MEINIWHLIFSSFFTIITALIIKKVQNGLEEKEKLKKALKLQKEKHNITIMYRLNLLTKITYSLKYGLEEILTEKETEKFLKAYNNEWIRLSEDDSLKHKD